MGDNCLTRRETHKMTITVYFKYAVTGHELIPIDSSQVSPGGSYITNTPDIIANSIDAGLPTITADHELCGVTDPNGAGFQLYAVITHLALVGATTDPSLVDLNQVTKLICPVTPDGRSNEWIVGVWKAISGIPDDFIVPTFESPAVEPSTVPSTPLETIQNRTDLNKLLHGLLGAGKSLFLPL